MTVKVTGSTKPTGPCDYVITSWLRNSRSHLIYLCNPTKNAVIRTLAVLWTVYVHCVGGSWLPSIGFTNALCACFTHMTTGHALIVGIWIWCEPAWCMWLLIVSDPIVWNRYISSVVILYSSSVCNLVTEIQHLLESIDNVSLQTLPSAAPAAKLSYKLANILSCNVDHTTLQ